LPEFELFQSSRDVLNNPLHVIFTEFGVVPVC
jgi:hypothetical protein